MALILRVMTTFDMGEDVLKSYKVIVRSEPEEARTFTSVGLNLHDVTVSEPQVSVLVGELRS